MWEKKKLLIWGKTYPEFSKKYFETVCTGAVDGETGKLIRIYPITLRYMDKEDQFHSYDWIEAEVERNTSDPRPESYRIRQDTIVKVGHLDTNKKDWAERARIILQPGNVFPSVKVLADAERKDGTSLGLVKPKQIVEVYAKKRSAEEHEEWEHKRIEALAQKDLFVDLEKTSTRDLAYVPVKYFVRFTCDAEDCPTEHNMGIMDWGMYVLHRRQYAQRGAAQAEKDVIAKIEELMDLSKRNAHFFLGNMQSHPTAFMIVGLFHPPYEKTKKQPEQTSLF